VEDDRADVEARLERRMRSIYHTAKAELYYDARWFLRMIESRGALATAQAILERPELAGGLAELAEAGRADFRIEALALEPQFARLFTEADRARAQSMLAGG
jgi:hypothetical protein